MRVWIMGAALLSGACQKATPSATGVIPSAQPAGPSKAAILVAPELLSTGRIKLGKVETRALSDELRVAGEVRSNELGTAEAGTLVAGRIASLEVAEGAQVKRGQVLAWVDAPEVARAAADLLLARAHAEVAQRKRARQETLDTESATSKNALDEARAADESARAELLAARTLLTSLGGTEPPSNPQLTSLVVRVPVRAPIAGVVAERHALLGAAVSPEKMLFRLVADAPGALSILARVPETVSPKPPLGASATISARGDESKSCPALVAGNLAGIDVETRTLALRLVPDKSCSWLMAGSFVDVRFSAPAASEDSAPSLIVPRSAVIDVRGTPTAFVATATPGRFEARALRLGPGNATEVGVDSGLNDGERLVTEGALLLKGELLRADLEGT